MLADMEEKKQKLSLGQVQKIIDEQVARIKEGNQEEVNGSQIDVGMKEDAAMLSPGPKRCLLKIFLKRFVK